MSRPSPELDLADYAHLGESPCVAWTLLDVNATGDFYPYGVAALMYSPFLGHGFVLSYCRECQGSEPPPADEGMDGWARWCASGDRARTVEEFSTWLTATESVVYKSPRPFDVPPPVWFERPWTSQVGHVSLRSLVAWQDQVIEVTRMINQGDTKILFGYLWRDGICIGEDSTPPLRKDAKIEIVGERPGRPRPDEA